MLQKDEFYPAFRALAIMASKSVIVGCLAGVIHHTFLQRPRQMPLPTTLFAFLFLEVILGGIAASSEIPFSGAFTSFLAMSLVYVLDL